MTTNEGPTPPGRGFPGRHLPKELRELAQEKRRLDGRALGAVGAWLCSLGVLVFAGVSAAGATDGLLVPLVAALAGCLVATFALSAVVGRLSARSAPVVLALVPWRGSCREPRWLQTLEILKRLDQFSVTVPEYSPLTSQIVQGLWHSLRRSERIRSALDADAKIGGGDVSGLRLGLQRQLDEVEPVISELIQALREIHLRAAAHDLGALGKLELRVRALTRTLDELQELEGLDDIVLGDPVPDGRPMAPAAADDERVGQAAAAHAAVPLRPS